MKTYTMRILLCVPFAVVGLSSVRGASVTDVAGVPGGLAVHVGAPDAKTALELAGTERWITLVLAPSASEADKLQAVVHERGAAGLITVGVWDGKTLPLADHMANLIVVDPAVRIDQEELLRTLVPVRGKALIRSGDAWKQLQKLMPANLDGWTHFFHGPDGNKVSRDNAFQVPDGLRFIAGPRLQDANGANGWRMDAGIAVSEWNYTLETQERDRTVMMVEGRDAFNGTLLWQRAEWIPRGGFASKKTKPLILDDGRFLRLSDDGETTSQIASFDPETGELRRVYRSSLNTRNDRYSGKPPQFNYHQGVIYQCDELKFRAFDAEKDEILWTYEHDSGDALTRPVIAADLGLAIVCETLAIAKWGKRGLDIFGGRYPNVHCDALLGIDLKTGKLRWRCPITAEVKDFSRVESDYEEHRGYDKGKQRFHAIGYKNGRVFCLMACDANGGNPSTIWAVDAKVGKSLWFAPCGPAGNEMREMFDLFLLDNGEIFTYGHSWCKLDQATGQLLAFGSNGGNSRCDTGACTQNVVTAGFGNYFDLAGDDVRWTKRDLARGQCGGWGTPAYGMMYYHGSGCGCFYPLRGNLALHKSRPPQPIDDDGRLKKGPAYDRPLGPAADENDWPAYLYNGQRRGWGPKDGPSRLTETWRIKVSDPIAADATGVQQDWLNCGVYNGPVTAPVVGGGMVFVSDRDRHRVVALDAQTGSRRWTFRIGGRVLTTPTYCKGRLAFGSRDGNVYVLDAKTGELAWRFFAAPEQRYLLAYGQIESLWPVHGCLPVVDDRVIATAGYHGEADGGVCAWGLDLKSGGVEWSRRLQRPSRTWKTFEAKQAKAGYTYLSVGDDEHDLAVPNKSNGAYAPTRVRNIDLPMHDEQVARVANCTVSIADGSNASRDVRDPLLIAGERYPFLDMEFEYRGGPHSSGSVGIQIQGAKIGGFRSDGMRGAHDGTNAVFVEQTSDHHVGPGLYYISGNTPKPEGWKFDRKGAKPIATSVNVLGREADSLALGGRIAYVASEGHLMRPWGSDMRPRPRWRKGEAIPGHLEAFSVPDGKQLAHVEVDSAVINNGLAVAGGRLYAVFEDGTVRCYE